MQELLFSRVRSIEHLIKVKHKDFDKIARLIVLYCCRFITSKEFRTLVSEFEQEDLQNAILDLKDYLDFSAIKNNLYRAAVDLVKATKRSDIKKINRGTLVHTAKIHGIDAYDLDLAVGALTRRDLLTLRSSPIPGKYTKTETETLLLHVAPVVTNLANKKLAFIINNDPSIESVHDIIGLLNGFAMRVILEYEVYNISRDHMAKNVVVSLKNFTSNLAEHYGRLKRSSIRRTHKGTDIATAWHLDIDSGHVVPVKVSSHYNARVKCGDNIKIFVKMPGDEKYTLVHYKRLYANLQEASMAWELHLAGKYSKRERYLDLSTRDYDEFQSTCTSIDAEDQNGITLIEKLPLHDDKVTSVLNDVTHLGPLLQEFASIVLHPEEHEFFVAWSKSRGIDLNQCTDKNLGTLACKYLGIEEQDVVDAVFDSPASAWSTAAQQRIDAIRKERNLAID